MKYLIRFIEWLFTPIRYIDQQLTDNRSPAQKAYEDKLYEQAKCSGDCPNCAKKK